MISALAKYVCVSRACHPLRFCVGEDEIVGRVYTGSLSQRAGGVCQTSQFLVAWMFLNRSLYITQERKSG